MKRFLLILSVMAFTVSTVVAQDKPYMVAFWNFENLFDIYDDPKKNDEDFLPDWRVLPLLCSLRRVKHPPL